MALKLKAKTGLALQKLTEGGNSIAKNLPN